MRKLKKKNVAKKLIDKHKIKGTMEVRSKSSWFSNAMDSLEKQDKEKKQ